MDAGTFPFIDTGTIASENVPKFISYYRNLDLKTIVTSLQQRKQKTYFSEKRKEIMVLVTYSLLAFSNDANATYHSVKSVSQPSG